MRAADTMHLARRGIVEHGRVETRRATVISDVARLQERYDWPGLKGLVIVESLREIGARTERETRSRLTSSTSRAQRLGAMVRDQWAVESSLDGPSCATCRPSSTRSQDVTSSPIVSVTASP
jgi:hypothetical protein